MSYREKMCEMVVEKPTGEFVKRQVRLFWWDEMRGVGIELIGDSPLKRYRFIIPLVEINDVIENGTLVETLSVLPDST